MGKRVYFLFVVLSSIVTGGASAAEWIVWDSPTPEFATILVRAMEAGSEGLPITVERLGHTPKAPMCRFHILRPTLSEDDRTHSLNYLECQVVTPSGPVVARVDFSRTPISYHGNRQTAKGFAWRGPLAEAFYLGLQRVAGETPLIRQSELEGPGSKSGHYTLYESRGGKSPFFCQKVFYFDYPKAGETTTYFECALTHWSTDHTR